MYRDSSLVKGPPAQVHNNAWVKVNFAGTGCDDFCLKDPLHV